MATTIEPRSLFIEAAAVQGDTVLMRARLGRDHLYLRARKARTYVHLHEVPPQSPVDRASLDAPSRKRLRDRLIANPVVLHRT